MQTCRIVYEIDTDPAPTIILNIIRIRIRKLKRILIRSIAPGLRAVRIRLLSFMGR